MKFDRSNKFDFCYYGQVNSLRLKSSVVSKWASKHLRGVTFILLAMVATSLRVNRVKFAILIKNNVAVVQKKKYIYIS